MADTLNFVQIQSANLAGSGCAIGDTSVVLKSFTQIDGTLLTMADFGTIGFGTLEPNNNTKEEQISFTGITQNGNGTATLTGVKSVGFVAPYTATTGVLKSHPGGVSFVISNTAGFYDRMTSKQNDETVSGLWTFTTLPQSAVTPTDPLQLATKAYVDSLSYAANPFFTHPGYYLATDSVGGDLKTFLAPVAFTNVKNVIVFKNSALAFPGSSADYQISGQNIIFNSVLYPEDTVAIFITNSLT